MDHHKWRSLHHALIITGHDIRFYLDIVRSLEDRTNACCESPIYISVVAFIESLNTVFTRELFRDIARKSFPGLGYYPNNLDSNTAPKVSQAKGKLASRESNTELVPKRLMEEHLKLHSPAVRIQIANTIRSPGALLEDAGAGCQILETGASQNCDFLGANSQSSSSSSASIG